MLFVAIQQPAAQNSLSLIPYPQEAAVQNGTYLLPAAVKISYAHGKGANDPLLRYLRDELKKQFDLQTDIAGNTGGAHIRIAKDNLPVKDKPAYRLTVDKSGIAIHCNSPEGAFYALQTLFQLVKSDGSKKALPYVTITDYPRFGYRGMHLDVSRHFFPVSFIKKYIDYLAYHKFNKFHWHLTDDQGWRIEIKKYPRLTSVGSWRHGTIIGRYPGTGNDSIRYGGFYTQAEVKDVVKYAAERYIDVIPEIEMPGHGSAAIAAYPQLSCFPNEPTIKYFPKECKWAGDTAGKQVQQTWGVFDDVFCAGQENTFKFLQDVLDEVLPLFPSKLIHIGGDECPKSNWKRCPNCQKRMKDNNLKDEHELQSYFITRIEKYLNKKGRNIIGWDEILEGGLAPNAAVMSWRGEEGGITAAKQKHEVVMTPGGWLYFDHSQSQNEDAVTFGGYTPVEKTYSYEPVPAALSAEEGKYILGAQANLWAEYIKNPARVEYMAFPRMSALSEVVWTAKEKRNWADFEKRLQVQFSRYEKWGANYSKAYFDMKASILPADDFQGVLWKVESKFDKPVIINFNNADSIWTYRSPQLIRKDAIVHASFDMGGKKSSISQKFSFNKATGKKISLLSPASRSYPGDGAFTLVNGVQNEKGMSRSREFLGFEGTDCEALIDLGTIQAIKEVTVHILESAGSWIYRPKYAEVLISPDGETYTRMGITDVYKQISAAGNGEMKVNQQSVNARYIKIKVGNHGLIADGQPGGGHKAWLFVDEIEVQ